MKKPLILVVLFIIVSLSATLSQEVQTNSVNRIVISEVNLQVGIIAEKADMLTFNDFLPLTDGLSLIDDLKEPEEGAYSLTTANNMYNVSIGFKFGNMKTNSYRDNPILRIGLGSSSGIAMSASYSDENRFRYDTLLSISGGDVFYLDTVVSEFYNISYAYEQLSINASLLFRTKSQSQLSAYAGIGAAFGISYKTRSDFLYELSKSKGISDSDENNYFDYEYGESYEFLTESFKNKSNTCFYLFMPFGLDVRLSKNNSFWKQMHLFYEFKPGVNIMSIPEVTTVTNPNLYHGFGIRTSWL